MSQMDIDPIFPCGEKNDAYAANIIGQSYLRILTSAGVAIGNVTFEPGCRQTDGQEPESMEPGTVIQVPAGKKHWHGAKADSWFTHIAVEVPGQDTRNEWLEPVTDEQYSKLDEKRSQT